MPQIEQPTGPQNLAQYLRRLVPGRTGYGDLIRSMLQGIGGEEPGPVFGGESVGYNPAREAMGLASPTPMMGRIINSSTSPIPTDILSRVLRSFPTHYRRLLTSNKTPAYTIAEQDVAPNLGMTEHSLPPGVSVRKFLGGATPSTGGKVSISPKALEGANPYQTTAHELLHVQQGMGTGPVLSTERVSELGNRGEMWNLLAAEYPEKKLGWEWPAFANMHRTEFMGREGDVATKAPVSPAVSPEAAQEFIESMRRQGKMYERLRKALARDKAGNPQLLPTEGTGP